jgi:hypothetical protein
MDPGCPLQLPFPTGMVQVLIDLQIADPLEGFSWVMDF